MSGKVTLFQYRLVLRGRDEVERAFEASSGGHRGKDIPQYVYMHGIYLHIIIMGEQYFSLHGSVMCFLSAWVLHIILACR